jgi:hypothetical protein
VRPAIARYDGQSDWYDETCADVATGMYFQTDTEDFATVVREVACCLRPAAASPTWASIRVT